MHGCDNSVATEVLQSNYASWQQLPAPIVVPVTSCTQEDHSTVAPVTLTGNTHSDGHQRSSMLTEPLLRLAKQ